MHQNPHQRCVQHRQLDRDRNAHRHADMARQRGPACGDSVLAFGRVVLCRQVASRLSVAPRDAPAVGSDAYVRNAESVRRQ